ncbi:MAG: hypothetical protein ACI8Z1_002773 [Candidatus Azotimanducaceae bacterium]|jgi:hypothetical protein
MLLTTSLIIATAALVFITYYRLAKPKQATIPIQLEQTTQPRKRPQRH